MSLSERRCVPCEGGVPVLTPAQAQELLTQLRSGWEVTQDGRGIRRFLLFKNFHEVMAFVNAVAWIAHSEDHHPDLEIGYNKCVVTYQTHAIGGLSENDFICAAKVDALGHS